MIVALLDRAMLHGDARVQRAGQAKYRTTLALINDSICVDHSPCIDRHPNSGNGELAATDIDLYDRCDIGQKATMHGHAKTATLWQLAAPAGTGCDQIDDVDQTPRIIGIAR